VAIFWECKQLKSKSILFHQLIQLLKQKSHLELQNLILNQNFVELLVMHYLKDKYKSQLLSFPQMQPKLKNKMALLRKLDKMIFLLKKLNLELYLQEREKTGHHQEQELS
jgi:hypothetical protein